MKFGSNSVGRTAMALVLAVAMLPWPALAQENSGYQVKKNVEIVLVNVVVRDKQGNIIRGLKKDDFTVTEDGKTQTLSSFDFEESAEIGVSVPIEPTASWPVTAIGAIRILVSSCV